MRLAKLQSIYVYFFLVLLFLTSLNPAMSTNTPPVESSSIAPAAEAPAADSPLRGRSVFMVETVAAGVAVRPAFLTDDGRLLDLPAVFPDLNYAMAQIEELKQLVSTHFSQAAQVGAQVIAAQAAANAAAAAANAEAAAPALAAQAT